ncbi:MAG: hypothetical protein ACAH59_11290 [Pseudobdellovibrionaceae bacterium]
MKLAFFFIFTVFLSLSAQAGNGPFSLGAILGDPTGLSAKYDLSRNEAIDGALSWSSGSRTGVQMHGDYLRIHPGQIGAGNAQIDLYYGIGARLIGIDRGDHKGKVSLGPRAPIGLKHELRDPSIEFFGELALILDLIPSTSADFDIGVGARYRF